MKYGLDVNVSTVEWWVRSTTLTLTESSEPHALEHTISVY